MIPKYFIAFFISIALVFSSAPVSAEESGGLLPPKNPDSVQWFEWGENAFELARRDNKPILL